MRFGQFFRTVGPVIAMAVASGTSGCEGPRFRFNGKEGVPLADLDLSGISPDTVNLVGPDIVRISEGEEFSIALEGSDEAKQRMRFLLDEGTLSIMRESRNFGENWHDNRDRATVSITMPAPEKLLLAGSGKIHSTALADRAEIVVAGSGRISTPGIDVDRLDVNLAGSGNARLDNLDVGRARIKLAGSGNATLSSDGKVDVRIMGSGNVTVRGNPRCTLKSFGSGTLYCEPRGATVDQEDED